MIDKKIILGVVLSFIVGLVIAQQIGLTNTSGTLDFEGDDIAINTWIKTTYGNVKTSNITYINNLWEYKLYNASNDAFWKIRFSGSPDDSQEVLNEKVDLWTSKWLEELYNKDNPKLEVSKTGRDFNIK